MRITRKTITALLSCIVVLTLFAGCAGKERIKKRVGTGTVAKKSKKSAVVPGARLKTGKPYKIGGVKYYPIEDAYGFTETGIASWYGAKFHGRKTANGETYDMYAMTAAHKTLPMPTMVEVTNLENKKRIVVRVNDRGPFVADRIIDLSKKAAGKLDILTKGTARVRIVALAEGQRPSPKEPPRPVKPVPDFDKGEFYVQVGAFSVRGNAERLKEKLERAWRKMRLERYVDLDGKPFTRVQAGPFGERSTAEEAKIDLAAEGFVYAFIVAK